MDTYFELKMLCLFYFVFESEKNRHNIETAVELEKQNIFFTFIFFLFFISIPNDN